MYQTILYQRQVRNGCSLAPTKVKNGLLSLMVKVASPTCSPEKKTMCPSHFWVNIQNGHHKQNGRFYQGQLNDPFGQLRYQNYKCREHGTRSIITLNAPMYQVFGGLGLTGIPAIFLSYQSAYEQDVYSSSYECM